MRRLHWQDAQTWLTGYPVPAALWKALDNEQAVPGVQVTKVAELFLSRFAQTPTGAILFDSRPLLRNSSGLKGEMVGFANVLATLRVFERNPHIYKIARDFGEALKQVRCNVPPRYLDFDGNIHCIEFPDGMTFDMQDGDVAQCAYVGMYRSAPDAQITVDGVTHGFMMDVTVPLYRGGVVVGNDNLRLYLEDGEASIEESLHLSMSWVRDEGKTGFSDELVAYIVNCLLYVKSGEPDLRALRPGLDLPLTVILVGFDYKKPKEYRADTAFRRTHLRWQAYGPGKEKFKLIWVKEHTMHFKKDQSE